MASNKKHYTDAEKKFFLRILVKYSHIIERKKSDATTLKDKEEAWNQICDSYNLSSIITSKRSIQQLKKLWSNLKSTQRDALTHEKQARLSTGGGPEPTSAEIDPDIAAIPNLMTTAPTLFSSNLSDEVIQERQQRILNDDCIPEELLTKYVENESSVDDNFKEVTNENLIIVRDTKESNSEIDEADKENTDILNTKHAILSNYKASTSKNVPVQKKCILEDINDIVLTPKKEIKKLQLENEENNNEKLLKLKRIKSIIDREQQLANLNIRHQEVIQKLEIDHLKEKYALEIRAATAAAELSELLLKEKQNK
ncbi:myb/SANT-like DNA-binding domain-containing protein 3 isoform X2 [Monomorium pharaonis]|uniref:myb/SANT-like DNA-binding domain-containing protein 3 isoform X2 n=1 Tax=Monomorium pharaonis TaxID=307658 RepID=UPI0017469BBE|nr:myb/SANT-like DNA-binding domain-containing protein 3 isoform X2 [Monomorium pharaonis]